MKNQLEKQIREMVKQGHIELRDMSGNVIKEGKVFEQQLKMMVQHLMSLK